MSLEQAITESPAALAQADEIATSAHLASRRLNQRLLCEFLALGEVVIVGALAFGALSNPVQIADPGIRFPLAAAAAAAAAALAAGLLSGAASYDLFASRKALLPGALVAALITAVAASASGASGPYILLCAATLFAGVYIARVPMIIVKLVLEATGRFSRLVAVVGNDADARNAIVAALRERTDIEIVYSGPSTGNRVLHSLCRKGHLDEIVLAGAPADKSHEAELAGLAVTLVRMMPQDLTMAGICNRRTDWSNPWNGPASVIARPPLEGWGGVFKRALDIVGSLAALILLSPVLLLTAIAIKLDSPGPIFFVQERAGYRTRPFRMLKFRSMHSNKADAVGAQLTLRDDPRVTRVGAFIRRTSIDELPQIFNVLMGHMSLVGPRPHPSGAKAGGILYDELIPDFYSRYRMKPGITGLAQVCGLRGNTETTESLIDRFYKDVEYANTWVPLRDVVIILRTVTHLMSAKNAF